MLVATTTSGHGRTRTVDPLHEQVRYPTALHVPPLTQGGGSGYPQVECRISTVSRWRCPVVLRVPRQESNLDAATPLPRVGAASHCPFGVVLSALGLGFPSVGALGGARDHDGIRTRSALGIGACALSSSSFTRFAHRFAEAGRLRVCRFYTAGHDRCPGLSRSSPGGSRSLHYHNLRVSAGTAAWFPRTACGCWRWTSRRSSSPGCRRP